MDKIEDCIAEADTAGMIPKEPDPDTPDEGDPPLAFRKPERPLRFASPRSKQTIFISGVVSILLGILSLGAALTAFILLPEFDARFRSFQIENKWTNLISIFAGVSAIALLFRNCSAYVCSTTILSLIAGAMGFINAILHAVNIAYRGGDIAKLRREQEQKGTDIYKSEINIAGHLQNLSVAIVLSSIAIGVVAVILHRYCVQMVGRNYGFIQAVEKLKFKLSLAGLGQIINGVLICCWWSGVEALFPASQKNGGKEIDLHALPTGEILSHGMVIACTGYLQMLTTAKGCRPMIVSATILNAISLVVSIYYAAHPLGVLYFAFENVRSTSHGSMLFDGKVGISMLLCIVYVVQVVMSIYSSLHLLNLCSQEIMPKLEHIAHDVRRRFTSLYLSQITLGVAAALLEILSISMFYAYKLDFTPTPLFVVTSGIFAHATLRLSYPTFLSASAALSGICAASGFRDLYLFVYHVSNTKAPDMSSAQGFLTGASITVHCLQALISLAVVIISLFMLVLYAKTMLRTTTIEFTIESKRHLLGQYWICVCQVLLAALTIGIGFKLFLNRRIYIEDFGDRAICLSVLIFVAGVTGIISRIRTSFYLAAFLLQLAAFTVLWQESDRVTFLVDYFARSAPMDPAHLSTPGSVPYVRGYVGFHQESLGLSYVVLLFFLAQFLVSGFYLITAGPIIEFLSYGRLDKQDQEVIFEEEHITDTAYISGLSADQGYISVKQAIPAEITEAQAD